jgi:hypothetical protein
MSEGLKDVLYLEGLGLGVDIAFEQLMLGELSWRAYLGGSVLGSALGFVSALAFG